MIYEVIKPCAALQDLISHFWVGTWDAASCRPNTTYYVIASSLTELTFGFNNNSPQADILFSAVRGHTHLPGQFPVDGYRHLVGVAFYAHAIPTLFRIPAAELNNAFLSLDTFLGRDGVLLREKMAMATDTQQRINLLSGYFINTLEKQQDKDELISHAIKEIRRCKGTAKIEKLAYDFNLSPKQFNRRFKACSGFNPKMYSRIIRFESVLIQYPEAYSLTELAHANDYFDQAHFIHEFKSFTGFTPKAFRQLSEDKK